MKRMPKCWIGDGSSNPYLTTVREFHVRLAKWYASNHQIANGQGGWIYTAAGKPLVQGWENLYFKFRGAILTEIWGTDFLEPFAGRLWIGKEWK